MTTGNWPMEHLIRGVYGQTAGRVPISDERPCSRDVPDINFPHGTVHRNDGGLMFIADMRAGIVRAGLAMTMGLMVAAPAAAQGQPQRRAGAAEAIPSIDDRTKEFKKIDGYFPVYWDEAAGRLWLEIPRLETEVLYSTGLATGLGSNVIGLDRGMLT